MASKETPKDAEYAFERNFKDAMRMNFNHFHMSRLTDYLLHPKISVDPKTVRVADIGTGTGMWASELAAKLPQSTIDAFDISPAHFPPEAWRLPNIRFVTHDCFKPFAEEFRGQYDVIHIRFWVCVVNDSIVKPVLDNILTLLKPGGYIQWFDGLPLTARVIARNGGAPTPACEQFVTLFKKPLPTSSFGWTTSLPGLFEEQGLEVVAKETFSDPDHYQIIGGQSLIAGLDNFVYRDQDGEAGKFQAQLASEFAAGAVVDHSYTCVVAVMAR